MRPFGGMTIERTWFAADKIGFHMLHTLFQTSLRYDTSSRYDEWFVTKLLVDDGRVPGRRGASTCATGRCAPSRGKAVILCTGGAGQIFPFTTNATIKTGDGMALAYRAGVALKDMEFVQYHPTGLPGTGILITEASRGEGGNLVNKDGERFLQDYDLGSRSTSRTKHPQKATWSSARATCSRTRSCRSSTRAGPSSGPYGDVRAPRPAPPRREEDQHEAPVRARAGEELRRHRSGVRADPGPPGRALHDGRRRHGHRTARRSLPGLYAAGESACVSHERRQPARLELADRVLVFGARAGARPRSSRPSIRNVNASGPASPGRGRAAADRAARFHGDGRRDDRRRPPRAATRRWKTAAASTATEASMQRDVRRRSRSSRGAIADVGLEDTSQVFNTELTRRSSSATCSTSPRPSRSRAGAQGVARRAPRSDFPKRDDQKYLNHSLAYRHRTASRGSTTRTW